MGEILRHCAAARSPLICSALLAQFFLHFINILQQTLLCTAPRHWAYQKHDHVITEETAGCTPEWYQAGLQIDIPTYN